MTRTCRGRFRQRMADVLLVGGVVAFLWLPWAASLLVIARAADAIAQAIRSVRPVVTVTVAPPPAVAPPTPAKGLPALDGMGLHE